MNPNPLKSCFRTAHKYPRKKIINIDTLLEAKLIKSERDGLKILARGKLTSKVELEVSGASETAVKLVEKADRLGGMPILADYAALTPNMVNAEEAMGEMVQRIENDELIDICTSTEVIGVSGSSPEIKIAEFRSSKTSSCLLYTSPSPRDRQKSRMPCWA